MSLVTLPAPSLIPATNMKKKLKDLRAVVVFPRRPADHASFHMLHLYRTNLEVRLRCIDESALQSDMQKKIYQSVTSTFTTPCPTRATGRGIEWDDLYKTERLIALLYSGAQLRQEISIYLQELAADSPKETEALRRDYEALLRPSDSTTAPADDTILRRFLLRVMEAVQWHAKKKYLSRPIRKEATKAILCCVLVAFVLVVGPYVILNFWGPEQVGAWWSLFALYTALTAGLMGAFFSRLIAVQRQWAEFTLEEVFLQREFSYTLLRAGVGMCGALVVYFFLRSEFMSGPLFPKFQEVAIRYVNIDAVDAVHMVFVMPSPALALLTFWCFLAGFSEALVPSILASTEGKLTDAGTARAKTG